MPRTDAPPTGGSEFRGAVQVGGIAQQ
jgi:hypothetical protein